MKVQSLAKATNTLSSPIPIEVTLALLPLAPQSLVVTSTPLIITPSLTIVNCTPLSQITEEMLS